MKWIIDSHIKQENDVLIHEKEYFCFLEENCLFGHTTQSEIICKDEKSSSRFSDDAFVPPIKTWEKDKNDSPFVPPVKADFSENASSTPNSGVPKCDTQQVLLLFVKADSGNSILSELKSEMKLSPKYSDDLYLETMNLWVGSKKIFDEKIASDFSLPDSKGEIPKLDFVVIQLQLCDNYPGYQMGVSSVDRMNFFKHICDKELPIIRLSNRLNFNNSNGASLSWEK